MTYEKQTWVDLREGNTPIVAARLNHMEDGIEAASFNYRRSLDYSIGTTLTEGADVFRWYNLSGQTLTIDRVWASFAAASTVTFDVNVNDTTIFGATKLELNSDYNSYQETVDLEITTLDNGDYITIDVDSVSGSPEYGIVSIDLSGNA